MFGKRISNPQFPRLFKKTHWNQERSGKGKDLEIKPFDNEKKGPVEIVARERDIRKKQKKKKSDNEKPKMNAKLTSWEGFEKQRTIFDLELRSPLFPCALPARRSEPSNEISIPPRNFFGGSSF